MNKTGLDMDPIISDTVSRFLAGGNIDIKFRFYSESEAITINSIVARVLSASDRIYLFDTITTILRELILNAVKANAKRIYFLSNSLEIQETGHYTQGMDEFRNDIMSNLDDVRGELEASDFHVIFEMSHTDSGILFRITNNSPIHNVELERLRHRMIRGKSGNNFSEIYETVFDSSEGAGLGIVLSLMLLRNSGMDPDSLRIVPSADNVSVSFLLPDRIHPAEKSSAARDMIINEINTLPTFPEHIVEIQRMCDDSKATIQSISARILSDPSLTADVLKLSNSAVFLTGRKVKTVQEALVRIGLKELKNILTVSATRSILSNRYRRYEMIWNHCNRTAAYALSLASYYGMENLSEQVFVAGLLHDIGSIVLLSIDEDMSSRIARIMETHILASSSILEEISIGISHTEIGERIARKWNFPDYLVAAIRHHHAPADADPEYNNMVNLIYMADMICGIEKKRYHSSFIEPDLLETFQIKSDADMQKLVSRLQAEYQARAMTQG